MSMSTHERLTLSMLLGFAVIFNLIGSSYLEFYPTNLLIGVAFAVGISMVLGSLYFFVAEPRPRMMRVAAVHGVRAPARSLSRSAVPA